MAESLMEGSTRAVCMLALANVSFFFLFFLLYFLSQNDYHPFHNHHDYHLCQEVTRAEYMGGLLVVIGHICLSYCQRLYAMIHVTDYIHTICER